MEKVLIGKIVNTHGVKGEIKIYPTANELEDFLYYKYFYIEGIEGKFVIEKSRIHKNIVIVKIKGIDDINIAQKYKNKDIYTDRESLRELEENEYLISDIVGCKVYSEGREIGVVEDVLEYSANDVLSVTGVDGKQILIPNLKQFVKEINIEEKKIEVKLIKGMM